MDNELGIKAWNIQWISCIERRDIFRELSRAVDKKYVAKYLDSRRNCAKRSLFFVTDFHPFPFCFGLVYVVIVANLPNLI